LPQHFRTLSTRALNALVNGRPLPPLAKDEASFNFLRKLPLCGKSTLKEIWEVLPEGGVPFITPWDNPHKRVDCVAVLAFTATGRARLYDGSPQEGEVLFIFEASIKRRVFSRGTGATITRRIKV
jgi:hypothetical protein